MAMSFRAARNGGLILLLLIILVQSLATYRFISHNAERMAEIVTIDEVKLRAWYDVADIISKAKDELNDYRMERNQVIAPVDLLINRALREIVAIRQLDNDEDELANIEAITNTAKRFKQAVYAYDAEVRDGYRGGSSARELEAMAINTADQIVQLGRNAAAYVSKRIHEKNVAILQSANLTRSMVGGGLFLVIVATFILAVFLAKALAYPMKQLVAGTKRLAEGELGYQVPVHSRDEIGQLAASFNSMAEKLRSSRTELLSAKAYADNVISSMMNSLVVVDRYLHIRTVNEAACQLLEYGADELIRQPVDRILADPAFIDTVLERLIQTGVATNVETTFRAKDGRRIRVLFSGSVMRNAEGGFEALVCVAQDITLQKEAMRSAHLASLGEMAAGVAHEINNPINSIINFAQIVLDETEAGERLSEEIPRRIIREGDRVASIVRSLLSFAREGDKAKAPVNLREVLLESLALTETQLHKDVIALDISFPDDLPLVHGHFQQIQQVFLNIINNARYALNAKFTEPGDDKIFKIAAGPAELDGAPAIEVRFRDNGTGIPDGVVDQVLNPFFSTKPVGRGTGLGLTISHGIIADHNGKLVITSNEGEFTELTVTLPVHREQPEDAAE